MHIIGLTGSIAAGKSTVSAMLQALGAKIIDADIIAREVVEPGTTGSMLVREAFGDAVFLKDGRVDRRALGARVFADEQARISLNAILHPLVIVECLRRAKEAAEFDQEAIAVIDAALLIEAGMHDAVDEVWLVIAHDSVRLRRIMERDDLTGEQAQARMDTQMTQDEKRRFASVVIDNSGDLEQTRMQVELLFKRLKQSAF